MSKEEIIASELIHQLHTPEELVAGSNFAHNIEGVIILLLALTLLLKKREVIPLQSLLLIGAGVFLFLFTFTHHPPSEWPLVFQVLRYDRQQLQHFLIALAAFLGGALLRLLQVKKSPLNILVIPASLSTIGVIFLMHPQHGLEQAVYEATWFHEVLGALFVASGFLFLASEFIKQKLVRSLAFFVLLVASILLITYREPTGAYHFSRLTFGQNV